MKFTVVFASLFIASFGVQSYAATKGIPKGDADALHRIFVGNTDIGEGVAIALGNKIDKPNPVAATIAAKLKNCAKTSNFANNTLTQAIGGAGCPLNYAGKMTFSGPLDRPTGMSTSDGSSVADSSILAIAPVRAGSDKFQVSIQYPTAATFTATGSQSKSLVSDSNQTVVLDSTISASGIVKKTKGGVEMDGRHMNVSGTLHYGAQTHTGSVSINIDDHGNAKVACTIDGTAANCAELAYILGNEISFESAIHLDTTP